MTWSHDEKRNRNETATVSLGWMHLAVLDHRCLWNLYSEQG